MEVSGSQKIKASRHVVFQGLLDPQVLQNSIPGCESAEFVDFPTGRQLKMTISIDFPGFKGSHTIFMQTGEVVAPSRVVLITEPSSPVGSVKATCTIDLSEAADGTDLNYNAVAERGGKIAAIPDIMIRGAVKSALERFFKNFEKQVASIPA
jgi:uncharacterized protein